MADTSFAVLGLERGDMTAQQILAVLQQYRDSNRLTPDQSTKINQLAIDTQVIFNFFLDLNLVETELPFSF